MEDDFFFCQLFEHESSTYTYILGDKKTNESVIIDPVLETVERDAQLISELNLKILYILETHLHADHITGSGFLRKKFAGKIGISSKAPVQDADLLLSDGQVINFGSQSLTCLATPGHTDTCMSYLWKNKIFTGDALFIRGTGRTDFQQGSSETLFKSIRDKLFSLPDETIVYPAHDYKGHTFSTIGWEKKWNPRVGLHKTKEDFKKIMAELNMPRPKKIDIALPANLLCGQIDLIK